MQRRRSTALFLTACLLASAATASAPPPPASASLLGTVDMEGDSTVDSDALVDTTATQYRWHSYPGSRLTINANQASDVKAPAGPLDAELSLNAGGWFGTEPTNFNDLVRTQLASIGGAPSDASSVSTAWYPYKLDMDATFATPTGASLSGYDFMADADSTIVRVISLPSTVDADVVLSGAAPGSEGAQWVADDDVVLISDDDWHYAVRIVSLSGSELTPVALSEEAVVSGAEWTFRKSFTGGGNVGVAIGFAAEAEGSAAAIARAKGAFVQPVATTLAQTKGDFDSWLQDVPAPGEWGVTGVDARGVTAQAHEKMYYSAWVFMLQNLVNALPENSVSYPYPQMMAGKPSLWNEGSEGNPGTAQWESAFGYQMLSFVMPDIAWDAYLGLLSEVDSSGIIGGESLPTRLAQTAWMLYENSGDAAKLASAYPDLKRFLDWAEDSPRWICCGHDIPEEKDLQFVASWLFDAEFAVKIADELGMTSDVALWQSKRTAMIADVGDLFFGAPDVIHGLSYPYTEIPPAWGVGNDMFKTTAISIDGLAPALMNRLTSFFMSIHRPDRDLSNFHYHKYPDVSLITYGLLDNGGHVEAREFAASALRDVIRGKEFAEVLVPTAGGVSAESVAPSLFTAAEAIELTWLMNGVRIDSGAPQAFSFGTSSLAVAPTPDALPVLESFADITDWASPYNAFMSADSGAAMIRYEDVQGDSSGYGVVEKEVTYDVDDHPLLSIDVGEVYGADTRWALKVNDGSGDVTLQAETRQRGKISYDLRSVTGWSGTKTFDVRLYAVGGLVKVQDIWLPSVALESFTSPSGWATSTATLAPAGGLARVASTAADGTIRKSFTYDIDRYPNLAVRVTDVGAGSTWALKVDDGTSEFTVQADTDRQGELTYDLASVTSWNGSKTFDLVVYAVGGPGAYVELDRIDRVEDLPSVALETFSNPTGWATSTATFEPVAGIAKVTSTGSNGTIRKSFTYDVERYPQLVIDVTDVGAASQWALKVDDGTGDVTLQADTTATGELVYDLASRTSWTGVKTFDVVIYAVGGTGSYVRVDDLHRTQLAGITRLESFSNPVGWATSTATLESGAGVAKITSTAANGTIRKTFRYDVDAYPNLIIRVTDVGGGSLWALKVDDGSGDITLQSDIDVRGELVYDLKALTSWSGVKTFDIVIYAIGNPGSYLRTDYIDRRAELP